MDPDLIRARYADRAAYLAAYAAATDAAIAAGFVLAGGPRRLSWPRPGRTWSTRRTPDSTPILESGNGPDRSCPDPGPWVR